MAKGKCKSKCKYCFNVSFGYGSGENKSKQQVDFAVAAGSSGNFDPGFFYGGKKYKHKYKYNWCHPIWYLIRTNGMAHHNQFVIGDVTAKSAFY